MTSKSLAARIEALEARNENADRDRRALWDGLKELRLEVVASNAKQDERLEKLMLRIEHDLEEIKTLVNKLSGAKVTLLGIVAIIGALGVIWAFMSGVVHWADGVGRPPFAGGPQ